MIDEKLTTLKNKTRGFHADARRQVKEWEERIAKLSEDRDWLALPATKRLAEIARERVKDINRTLCNSREIPETARIGLLFEKDAHMQYLSALNLDPERELAEIESAIDGEL